jgi:hypothetical protein
MHGAVTRDLLELLPEGRLLQRNHVDAMEPQGEWPPVPKNVSERLLELGTAKS